MKSEIEPNHGEHLQEIEVTITEKRHVASTDSPLFRVMAANGNEYVLFIEEHPSNRFNFEVGNKYRLKYLLGFDPTFDENEVFRDEREQVANHECPKCGGSFSFESRLVTPSPTAIKVLKESEAKGPQLVAVEKTECRLLHPTVDWRPFEAGQGTRTPTPNKPEAVCNECSLDFPVGDLAVRIDAWTETDHRTESRLIEDSMANAMPETSDSLGMATGGGKDIDNFRENIKNGYLPSIDSLSYEGLFYEYYFDTNSESDGERDSLFYPAYSVGITNDPITDEAEHYLTVGLNSTLNQSDFERPQLNLVAVLDVSGSMTSNFDQYYYDQNGKRQKADLDSSITKMEAATESLAALTYHLKEDDRFGVVLYNNNAHLAKPLTRVGGTDMDAIRSHIHEIRAGGGTNMVAGLETAMDQFDKDTGNSDVENRIIFMTDAMPNVGTTGRNSIADTVESAATSGIHTTFFGMGIDANSDLIDSLSKIRGANHYFVNTPEEFRTRLDDEFEFMVSPLVFDLQLELEGAEIESVYGSPNAEKSEGTLMYVSTLFPSPTTERGTKGSVVLIKLAEKPTDGVTLRASWEELTGQIEEDRVNVEFPSSETEQFENNGIRKAIVLTRYVRTLREWIEKTNGQDDWNVPGTTYRNPWEQSSSSLSVPESIRPKLETIQQYLEDEREVLEDTELDQEIRLLDLLLSTTKNIETNLNSEERKRLQLLVELSPTKNSELAEAWGLPDGPAVHQYLEDHLKEFYYRDEQKCIKATDEAVNLVENTRNRQ